MNGGLWVWPADPKKQRRVLRKLSNNKNLMTVLKAVQSKEGLSNAQIDDLIGDNSEWLTVWVVRQLMSAGFVQYRTDLFGGPGIYLITDLGRQAVQWLSGQPVQSTATQPITSTRNPVAH
jgi:hypothetical protein